MYLGRGGGRKASAAGCGISIALCRRPQRCFEDYLSCERLGPELDVEGEELESQLSPTREVGLLKLLSHLGPSLELRPSQVKPAFGLTDTANWRVPAALQSQRRPPL